MLMTLVVLLVIAAVGVGAWTIGRSLGSPTTSQTASAAPTSTQSATVNAQVVKPKNAKGFDPLGDGDEKERHRAKLAIDGKPGTLWKTETYTSADLAGSRTAWACCSTWASPCRSATWWLRCPMRRARPSSSRWATLPNSTR
ncbi:hypothetical protein [Nonomuraea rubra]|uniref:hypothetical protein n=1 Tax=Nonomuraea rubra TaxID=46180 RepID=UPI0031EC98B6